MNEQQIKEIIQEHIIGWENIKSQLKELGHKDYYDKCIDARIDTLECLLAAITLKEKELKNE